MIRLSSFGVLLAISVSCGGGDSGGASVGDFLTQSDAANCQAIFRCCSTAELATEFMGDTSNGKPITTEAQCEQFENGFVLLFGEPVIQGSIGKNRVKFDGDNASACIDAIKNLSCDELGGDLGSLTPDQAACADVLEPQVASGGACSQSYECTTGFCMGAMTGSDGTLTDGACADLPATGSACTDQCGSGDFCDFGSNETCQPKKAAGADCEDGNECASTHCEGSAGSDGGMTCVAICTGA